MLDTAYSLAAIRERQLERSVIARDLDGWFDHVWSVHPLVGADRSVDEEIGPIASSSLAPRHTVIEAHVGRFGWLRRLPPLNFVVAQMAVWRHLSRLIAREGVDVVRVGDPYYLGLMGLSLSRRHRIPLVVRINGNYDAIYDAIGRPAYPRLFRRRSVERPIGRFVLRRAALVAAPSKDNLDFALYNGARPDASTVFPFGNLIHESHWTDPRSRASVRDDLGIGDRPFVVYVTRLEPVKHPADLLHVATRLRDEGLDVGVVLVGDGSMRPDLERLARDLDVADSVVFAGARDQPWIARCLAAAAVIAAPHNGRALVEAALAGRPIVAYDIDWHRELIESGVNGVLVPDGDRDAMASAILSLLARPDEQVRMGRAARVVALETMSPDRLVAHERARYAAILDPARR